MHICNELIKNQGRKTNDDMSQFNCTNARKQIADMQQKVINK